jgi:hypothetical protein
MSAAWANPVPRSRLKTNAEGFFTETTQNCYRHVPLTTVGGNL